MGLFKPFIKGYVPFEAIEEIVLRAISILLAGGYFTAKKNGQNIIIIEELNSKLESVKTVYNKLFLRVKNISKKDANRNSFVVIDSINQMVTMEIDDGFNSIEYLFEQW